jgi:hypothetical protein
MISFMKYRDSFIALLVMAVCLMSSGSVCAQVIYDEAEAYAVYSTVLPGMFAIDKPNVKKLIFQAETGDFDNQENPHLCLKPDPSEEPRLGPLLLAYKQANASRRLLQPKFDIKVPYEFVAKSTIDAIIGKNFDGWPAFYEK